MGVIGSFEAKTHLSSLLEKVEQGETFTITRHGTPVARLVPINGAPDVARISSAIDRLEALASRHEMDTNWRTLRDLGRKW